MQRRPGVLGLGGRLPLEAAFEVSAQTLPEVSLLRLSALISAQRGVPLALLTLVLCGGAVLCPRPTPPSMTTQMPQTLPSVLCQ